MNLILNMLNFRCQQNIQMKMWTVVEYDSLELKEQT